MRIANQAGRLATRRAGRLRARSAVGRYPTAVQTGKSLPRFGPIGPWLITLDEFADPNNLELYCATSGEQMQHGRTSDQIFSVPALAGTPSVVRGNAAVQTVAGATLALGILPRASAVALLALLIPTTIAGLGFRAIEDPAARKPQRIQFQKNIAMLGGLLFVILDSTGPNNRWGASR